MYPWPIPDFVSWPLSTGLPVAHVGPGMSNVWRFIPCDVRIDFVNCFLTKNIFENGDFPEDDEASSLLQEGASVGRRCKAVRGSQ